MHLLAPPMATAPSAQQGQPTSMTTFKLLALHDVCTPTSYQVQRVFLVLSQFGIRGASRVVALVAQGTSSLIKACSHRCVH